MTPEGDSRRSTTRAARAATGSAAPWLAVELQIDDDAWGQLHELEPAIAAAVAKLCATLGPARPATATLALADDRAVRGLNREFRAKDQPTNVLSFPAPQPSAPNSTAPRYLGDVIMARETLLAEAADAAIPPLHHLQHLAIHGLLHLLGYDHQTDADAAVMERIETTALGALGIADPYADAPTLAPNAREPRP